MPLVREQRRGYGHRPGPASPRPPPAHALLGGATPTPSSVSLLDAAPDVMDQGSLSACVGFALCCAIETRMAILGRPLTPRSPVCIYDLARCVERVPLPSAEGPVLLPLEDRGSMPSAAVAGIREWGVCAYAARPTDAMTVNDEPRLAELEGASGFLLSGLYEIVEEGSARVARIRQALAAGFPVCFAIQADDAFEAYMGGVLGPPDAAHVRGGHYVCGLGYTTAADGSTVLVGRNSWSEGWGEQGNFRGNEDFIAAASDLYIVEVEAA